jgi:hypothetical protein
MLYTIFIMPISVLARAIPIDRIAFFRKSLCDPNTCSTRQRTFDFLVFAFLDRSLNGFPRLPLRCTLLR